MAADDWPSWKEQETERFRKTVLKKLKKLEELNGVVLATILSEWPEEKANAYLEGLKEQGLL